MFLAYKKNTSLSFANLAAYASMCIRDSKAIKEKHYQKESSLHIHIDGKGLSFITSIETQHDNFQRTILLLALAYAYINVAEHFTNKLSELTRDKNTDIEKLSDLYEQMATFNAHFFFRYPVQNKKTSLASTWEKIDSALGISSINNELFK